MSAHILADIYRRVQVSPAESRILQTLAQYANIHGYNARMSYEALAKATGYSVRWVIALVGRLEAKHLLRVKRVWLGFKRCAINVYQIVKPWLLEAGLTYREVYERKRANAQLGSERIVHGHPARERKRETTEPLTHEECIKMGLTEGSLAYRASRGFPDDDTPQENPQTKG